MPPRVYYTMKYPFFATFLLFVIVFNIVARVRSRKTDNTEEAFRERESAANAVRRKSLDDLTYVDLSSEAFPVALSANLPEASEILEQLRSLVEKKAVNLSAHTNTELKEMYGVSNLPLLTEYDQNFTEITLLLQKWAALLWEKEEKEAAAEVLRYAVSLGSDLSQTYGLLAQYYAEKKDLSELQNLAEKANALESSSKALARAAVKEWDISEFL